LALAEAQNDTATAEVIRAKIKEASAHSSRSR
jgi:hypothetical protein